MMMRIGTTSFIYPADILTNVRELAGKVEDVELVIFETVDQGDNYPDAQTIRELCLIAEDHNLTYTVHLPLDLNLGAETSSTDTALRVINWTSDLDPFAFVVHMDGDFSPGTIAFEHWLDHSVRTLKTMSREVSAPERICVENLESQSPSLIDALLDRTPVSCCIDVGHLWKQGLDPGPWMDAWLPRSRVIHLHGVGARDHKALSLMSHDRIDPVIDRLTNGFSGVLTLEVFNEQDLRDSLIALKGSLARIRQ
jgi:sugar phosphate isomerase/epimerase